MTTLINTSESIFFDFDGVIKDSLEVKSKAFEELFLPMGRVLAKKVREHHDANTGVSRFEKIPIYLGWAGFEGDKKMLEKYFKKFSSLVTQRVVQSAWVDNIQLFLENHYRDKYLFLITATPQSEIEVIVSELKIGEFFRKIIGSPQKKDMAIKKLLKQYNLSSKKSIVIGDSIVDFKAASTNNIPFILRKTNMNRDLQLQLNCPMIVDFNYA